MCRAVDKWESWPKVTTGSGNHFTQEKGEKRREERAFEHDARLPERVHVIVKVPLLDRKTMIENTRAMRRYNITKSTNLKDLKEISQNRCGWTENTVEHSWCWAQFLERPVYSTRHICNNNLQDCVTCPRGHGQLVVIAFTHTGSMCSTHHSLSVV